MRSGLLVRAEKSDLKNSFLCRTAGRHVLCCSGSSGTHAGGKEPVPTACKKETYAGTMRMLRSTAWGECVSAPTEM